MEINVELSVKSIDKAIQQIEQYERAFASKLRRFIERLGEIGIQVIDENMAQIQGDSNPEHYAYIKLNSYELYAEGTLVLQGRAIAFIEFGAGVHYNGAAGTAAYDWAAEQGYTIGSYGMGLGTHDWWFYRAETGESKRSYGTKAQMPLYKADQKILEQIRTVANEVFRS